MTVFNHDAWAPRISHLVNEVLKEVEKRLSSRVLDNSTYHFNLIHSINYTVDVTSIKKPMTGPYNLLDKGYVDLAAEVADEDVSGVFVRAATGEEYRWQTTVKHKTYTVEEIAQVMYVNAWRKPTILIPLTRASRSVIPISSLWTASATSCAIP